MSEEFNIVRIADGNIFIWNKKLEASVKEMRANLITQWLLAPGLLILPDV